LQLPAGIKDKFVKRMETIAQLVAATLARF